MTGNKCLLDTSVIIHAFKNNSDIITRLYSFSEIFLSSIVAGELYYGAYKSANVKRHLDQIQEFLQNYIVLAPDVITADYWVKLKHR